MEGAGIPQGKTIINVNGCHSNTDKGSDHCGYCKGTKPDPGACQWGITSEKMTVGDYQKLMDRGWRRCGSYYYKYDFEKSCCQPYTIKLDITEYQISHSQKKVMKRFNKFLLGEIDLSGKKVHQPMQIDQAAGKVQENEKVQEIKEQQQAQILKILTAIVTKDQQMHYKITKDSINQLSTTSIINKPREKELTNTRSWSTNALMKLYYKLKELNKEEFTFTLPNYIEHLKQQVEELKIEGLKIEPSGYLTFINMENDDPIPKARGKSQPKKPNHEESKEEAKTLMNEELFYQQYFKEFCPLQLKPGQKLAHKYTVQITKSLSTEESFEVYKKYQATVHHEQEKSIQGYSRFLCNSPLFDPSDQVEASRSLSGKKDIDSKRVLKDEGVWPQYLGGYHMIHRLDGEIFAVGVIDLTPQVLSSVYLYYDPKYEFLSPGTLSAVREIEYCLRVQEVFKQDFKYYYMGYYFQDCQKSVYKANYKPSQVLCPQTYNYVYLSEEVKEMISKAKYPRLSDKPKLKELDLSVQQVSTLVENFKFCYRERMMLCIRDLDPSSVHEIKQVAADMYRYLGLDVMLNAFFVI